MSLPIITDTEKGQYGVTLLPNVPQITATALKQKFEEKSDDLIIPKFNELSGALSSSGAAAELGAKLGETDTTIQVTVNTILQALSEKQDTLTFDNTPTDGSANPVTSDGIYEALVSLSDGIQTVINTLQPKATAVKHTESTAVGSTKKGVYVDTDGSVKAMTYEVNKTVPSDAKFSDTTYTAGTNISIDENNKISVTGGAGSGDMLKAVYDTNNDGIVDKAATLDGLTASVEELNLLDGANSNIQDQLDGKQATLTFDNSPTKNSNNPVKSGGIKTAIDTSQSASEHLIHSTVGWTGKNVLPNNMQSSESAGGITYTKNADGSITTNAATITGWSLLYIVDDPKLTLKAGSYILSGVPNVTNACITVVDGSNNIIANCLKGTSTDEVQFTLANDTDVKVRIGAGVNSGVTFNNDTFYPMIRLAENTDSTYEPYHPSVEQCKFDRAEQAILGAKNLLVNERGNSTIEGVTFVVNADGTVTASGTPSNNNAFYDFYNPLRPIGKIPAGRYIFSGTPSGIDTTKYNMYVEIGGLGNNLYDHGNGVTFDYNGTDTLRFVIGIRTSAVSNLTFKPMLRLASDPDDTYAPYAMTNAELTEKKISIADLKTVTSASSDFADFKTRIAAL